MANSKTPSEGGSGGKRGHSAMEHYMPTAEVKESASRRRREENKKIIRESIREIKQISRDIERIARNLQ